MARLGEPVAVTIRTASCRVLMPLEGHELQHYPHAVPLGSLAELSKTTHQAGFILRSIVLPRLGGRGKPACAESAREFSAASMGARSMRGQTRTTSMSSTSSCVSSRRRFRCPAEVACRP